MQIERDAIYTVAVVALGVVVRALWTVGEYVSEVCLALFAAHLGSVHAVACVMHENDRFFIDWVGKAGPTRAGIKLGVGLEKWSTTDSAVKHTLCIGA